MALAAACLAAVNAGGGVTASGCGRPGETGRPGLHHRRQGRGGQRRRGRDGEAGQPLAQLDGQEDLAAAISQAEFELVQAQQALEDLKTEAETARVQAMQDIITYEKAVRDAQYALDNFTVPVEPGWAGYRRGAQPDEAAPGRSPRRLSSRTNTAPPAIRPAKTAWMP